MGLQSEYSGSNANFDDQPPAYDGPSTSLQFTPSTALPQTQIACLSINAMDRIRLNNFPENVVAALHDAASKNWSKGVDKVATLGVAREIKLKGFPWHPDPNGNDEARLMLLNLISKLYEMGWIIHAAMSFSHYATTDKDTLFFRKRANQPPSPQCEWMYISFDYLNKLKVIGDLSSDASGSILQALGTRVASHETSPGRLKVKFHAHTWLVAGEDAVCTQSLVLSLLNCLETIGFRVYSTFPCQTGLAGYEMDGMVCLRERV